MARKSARLEGWYRRLAGSDYEVTSDEEPFYNCIAHALGESHRFYDPIMPPIAPYYWPTDVPRQQSAANWIAVFRRAGYEVCASPAFEEGYEKVAIYVERRDGSPVHVAKQLPSGVWTSKMGK